MVKKYQATRLPVEANNAVTQYVRLGLFKNKTEAYRNLGAMLEKFMNEQILRLQKRMK